MKPKHVACVNRTKFVFDANKPVKFQVAFCNLMIMQKFSFKRRCIYAKLRGITSCKSLILIFATTRRNKNWLIEGNLKPNPLFPIRLYDALFDEVRRHLHIYFNLQTSIGVDFWYLTHVFLTHVRMWVFTFSTAPCDGQIWQPKITNLHQTKHNYNVPLLKLFHIFIFLIAGTLTVHHWLMWPTKVKR